MFYYQCYVFIFVFHIYMKFFNCHAFLFWMFAWQFKIEFLNPSALRAFQVWNIYI